MGKINRTLSEERIKQLEELRGSKIKRNNSCKYRITRKEWEIISGITQAAKEHNVDPSEIKHIWVKNKNSSAFIKNPFFNDNNNVQMVEAFDDVASKYISGKVRTIEPKLMIQKKALKATTSDDHVGMNPNPGNSMFEYDYNADIYTKSMDKVYNAIVKEHKTHGHFDLLLLDNLGDQQDGFNKLTTRGTHELPQNMTNAEVFHTCIDVKTNLIINLIESGITNRVWLRNVVNDNHSGDFGYIISIALQKIINKIYSEEVVKVDHLTRFLEYRTYGKHCFILTHGKDKKERSKGLPLVLDHKTINYINQFIDSREIEQPFIHVEKGDLHQIGYQRTKKFDYRNFMSFAPPSNWVQHNFGDCYSGFSIQIIPKNSNEISHTDYFLDYQLKKYEKPFSFE
jgi:hypothetical protein